MRNIIIGCCLLLIGIFTLGVSFTYLCTNRVFAQVFQTCEKDLRDIEGIHSEGLSDDSSAKFLELSSEYRNMCEDYRIKHEGFLVAPFFISILAGISGGFYIFCAIAIFTKKQFIKKKILYAVIIGVLLFSLAVIWTFKEVNFIIMMGGIKNSLMSLLNTGNGDNFALRDLLWKKLAIVSSALYGVVFCLIPFLCWFFYRDNEMPKVKDVA